MQEKIWKQCAIKRFFYAMKWIVNVRWRELDRNPRSFVVQCTFFCEKSSNLILKISERF